MRLCHACFNFTYFAFIIIQFSFCPFRPFRPCPKPQRLTPPAVYHRIDDRKPQHTLAHSQGLCVATLFCFCNGEVIAQVKRKWGTIFYSNRPRANSYTATQVSVSVYIREHKTNSVSHLMMTILTEPCSLQTTEMYKLSEDMFAQPSNAALATSFFSADIMLCLSCKTHAYSSQMVMLNLGFCISWYSLFAVM